MKLRERHPSPLSPQPPNLNHHNVILINSEGAAGNVISFCFILAFPRRCQILTHDTGDRYDTLNL